MWKEGLTEGRDETDDEPHHDAEDGGWTEAGADVPHFAVRLVVSVIHAADDLKTQS
jgi:hypothetical protein